MLIDCRASESPLITAAPVLAALTLVSLLAPISVSAQELESEPESTIESPVEAALADGEQERAAESETPRPIEEITVRGQQTLMSLRFQLRQAEEDLYKLFNDLNSDDDFDILCRNTRRTGSHIARRSCEPRFLSQERQSNSAFVISQMRDAAGGGGATTPINLNAIADFQRSEQELREMLADRFEAMGEEMLRLAAEHPQYLEALMRFEDASQAYHGRRQERFGN